MIRWFRLLGRSALRFKWRLQDEALRRACQTSAAYYDNNAWERMKLLSVVRTPIDEQILTYQQQVIEARRDFEQRENKLREIYNTQLEELERSRVPNVYVPSPPDHPGYFTVTR